MLKITEMRRSGEYKVDTDEQPEITLEIAGNMVVYGDESLENFKKEHALLVAKYSI